MMGTLNCIYETHCGWCSKVEKKCDRKIKEFTSSDKLAAMRPRNPIPGRYDLTLEETT